MANRIYYFAIGSAKGNLGKSTFAANLATALLIESKARVCIVDMDTANCGDIANIMGVTQTRPMTELAPLLDRLDLKTFYGQMARHKTGITILPLFHQKKELSRLTSQGIDHLFRWLSQIFNFVIIDCGTTFDRYSIKAYEYAAQLFFLTTPDILALSQAERRMADFRSLQFPANMVRLILNQFNPRGVITKEIIHKKLNKEPLMAIPLDPHTANQAIHEAVPFVLSQPRSPISKSYIDLARFILQPRTIQSFHKPGGPGSISPDILQTLNPAISPTDHHFGAKAIAHTTHTSAQNARRNAIKMMIHKKLIEVIDLKNFTPEEEAKMDPQKLEDLRAKAMTTINQLIESEVQEIKSIEERRRLAKEVLNEALGLGVLEDLLEDDEISEIMVNHKDQVYVERNGKLVLTDCSFTSNKYLLSIIERIVAPIGRRIDEKTPMVDARLKDGSRVNAIIPPLSLKGPMLTIRKFSRDPLTYKDLVKFGTFTEEIADFFRACIESHLNIIISGGTGTGKTTLLNVLSSFIPESERIITVEDSAELQLKQPHVGTLETRPPNLQGENAITIRDLIKNTLRMRPDRIVVGECRGAEALDMLQAMNTGHDGSLTTIHSNSPRDCIQRLETLVMFAGYDLPAKAIREQIASAVDIIIQVSRLPDGARKVTYVTEVGGIESDTVILQDIFQYKQTGVTQEGKVKGTFISTGLIPKFVETLKQKGIRLPQGLFSGGAMTP